MARNKPSLCQAFISNNTPCVSILELGGVATKSKINQLQAPCQMSHNCKSFMGPWCPARASFGSTLTW
ncbi:hypothetical protein I79_016271 [Cricetulus griseus]|uniref:Uncharacterized protein n=1 Tax=Cricetulus griseus TaxID=10029 RepID=G3HYX8_CRIGR|nr:hypothetical protein I79_016271 [Cricetulus griseus]